MYEEEEDDDEGGLYEEEEEDPEVGAAEYELDRVTLLPPWLDPCEEELLLE